mmetsp:Transcript_15894/g.40555  ORF Transcript_15894/g.40555 Transcript_15894/m.40555 type:complete len:254 (-) Transcript_15894:87-848(-)
MERSAPTGPSSCLNCCAKSRRNAASPSLLLVNFSFELRLAQPSSSMKWNGGANENTKPPWRSKSTSRITSPLVTGIAVDPTGSSPSVYSNSPISALSIAHRIAAWSAALRACLSARKVAAREAFVAASSSSSLSTIAAVFEAAASATRWASISLARLPAIAALSLNLAATFAAAMSAVSWASISMARWPAIAALSLSLAKRAIATVSLSLAPTMFEAWGVGLGLASTCLLLLSISSARGRARLTTAARVKPSA